MLGDVSGLPIVPWTPDMIGEFDFLTLVLKGHQSAVKHPWGLRRGPLIKCGNSLYQETQETALAKKTL